MKAVLTILIATVASWSISCALYAFVAYTVFSGSIAHTINVVYWDFFYTAWHSIAFSVFILGPLVFAPKIRLHIFNRSGFIAVGLLGGIFSWPLGVTGWSMLSYQNLHIPWFLPNLTLDVPVACIVGLSSITFYGLFLGLGRFKNSAEQDAAATP